MFGLKKKEVIIDNVKIDEILERGIENIFPNKEFLKSKLMKGERISIYLGIDPTGPTLHLGHVIPLIKLGQLQELGHQIILLMGDFTATIGDPTGKDAVRKQLTHEEVMNNLKEYKNQASKFISFNGSNPAIFKFNSEWLKRMDFTDILKLTSLMTVDQMMKRDMFVRRSEEGRPIHIHEFLYPLMQGFDSVAMDVDGEIGGNDQTFNMLVGRDLLKTLKSKDKFVIATKLLVDSNGKKMGKTEGNMVSLDQNPEEMFGRVMSWGDGLLLNAFELVTKMPINEIKTIKEKLENGENPKDIKVILASEIVKMYYGEKEAGEAAKKFETTFSKGEFPEDAPVFEAPKEEFLYEIILKNDLVSSKSEWRRLVEAGAVSGYPDIKIHDPNHKIGESEMKLKIGKKVFVIIKPK